MIDSYSILTNVGTHINSQPLYTLLLWYIVFHFKENYCKENDDFIGTWHSMLTYKI